MADDQPQPQNQAQVEATPLATPVPEAKPTQPASDVQVSPPPEALEPQGQTPDLSEKENTEIPQDEPQNTDQQPLSEQSNTNEVQQNVSEQEQPAPPPNPSFPSAPSIPSLVFPFYYSFPVSFAFGAQPDSEDIKKKYAEWRLVGHNGIDFGLSEGTEVLACDEGTIIQSGDNGDFGISITIQHSWGTSLYAHLKETKVSVNQQVKKGEKLGLSGKTGFVTAEHLHFAVQPLNPDVNNGYLGYIDPTPYLTETITKPEPRQQTQPEQTQQTSPPRSEQPSPPSQEQQPTPPPVEQKLPEPPKSPDLSVSEPPQQPQSPVSPLNSTVEEITPPSISYDIPNFGSEESKQPEAPAQQEVPTPPTINPTPVEQQSVGIFDAQLKEHWQQYQPRGNQVKKEDVQKHLDKIMAYAEQKKTVSNQDIRDLLHVSQTTATRYLAQLAGSGMLKMEKKGKNTFYSYGLSLS